MRETILPKLEASRKELLDLGMRNTLLNYKTPKARGLRIVLEQSSSIYEILVRQNKAMTFLGRKGKDDDETLFDLPVLTQPELEDAYVDLRLQTNESEKKLQTKILNTYYFARTSIEEQGVNLLYLSLGMLNWYENGNKEEPRLAPLILLPVTLERSSASERFRLRYSGADIGSNLSLKAKMMADFNITIPDLPEEEEFDMHAYFQEVVDRIKHLENWRVDIDAIELGFFSFGKFMIYHDLDSTKWPENKLPADNKILQSLFGGGFNAPQPTANEEHFLDTETDANSLLQVVDADSSQVLAMLAVQEGSNMVIQGPPGTGKSQTITNLIADAVGNGKTVLFVAEKMAALEVVKRRLDNINLGEACLELHSHKANKRELHKELKKVLELGKPTLSHLEEEIKVLGSLIVELNDYCNEINIQIANSGHSAHEVIGHLLRIYEENKDYKFPKLIIKDIENWNVSSIKAVELLAEQIQVRLAKIGQPENLIFYGVGLNVFLPTDEELLNEILREATHDTKKIKNLGIEVAKLMTIDDAKDRVSIEKLIKIADLASRNPGTKSIAIRDNAWLNNEVDIQELIEVGTKLEELHAKYDPLVIPEAWDQNLLELRQNLIAHGSKWYKFLIGDYKKSVKQLSGLLKSPMPEELDKKVEYINALMEGKRLSKALDGLRPLAERLFGNNWQKLRTNWKGIENITTYLKSVHIAIEMNEVPLSFFDFLDRNESPEISEKNADELKSLLDKQKDIINNLLDKIHFNNYGLINDSFSSQLDLLERWQLNLAEIHQIVSWNVLTETIKEKGGEYLLDAVYGWPDAADHLKTAFQKTVYDCFIEKAMLTSSALRKFERTSHEEVIDKFKKLDVLNQHYNRAKVALKHWKGIPSQEGGGQITVLKSEFNRKARHMPIRRLMQEAGLAIQAIKPVIMMSPMSIANFLPPGSVEFDLVIFDEASQVRPVDALGAILRGKQIVVVGDTKQMPPTSFFDKLNTDIDEDVNVTADMQSILGMCDAQGVAQRMLRWHYRSKHESLISLSNQEFYENKLVIFPSPGSKHRMGLVFHHIADSFYDKGKTRTNPKEAEKVADAVIEHALHFPKQSLGVVAFSTAQMQAIQDAIEIKRRKNPDVENYFRSHANEPFFVKNLENVQGDERDIIFISIGYGRLEDGKVPMSFGPLNNEGGERRLNVLITRAKSRCEVFTNIKSSDMKPGPTAKFGIRALKSFLYFAEHGKFESTKEILEIKKEPFEDIIAERLRNEGYIIREKVGSAGFYIDLTVVDNDNPGRYILGISCDGKSYVNAKSARDRDRLRNTVLEGMGWKLYNVWSIDWFRNPEKELKLLVEAIEKAKLEVEQIDAIEEEFLEEMKNLVREEYRDTTILVPGYVTTVLPQEVAGRELHLFSLGQLGGWISEVVKVESPVHFEEMARRMATFNGISKIGSRVRATLVEATNYALKVGLISRKGDFLWDPVMTLPYTRERSSLSSNSRKLNLISPEEINVAIKKVVESSIAIQPDNAIPFIAKLFGFNRVTEDMRKQLIEAIQYAISKNIIIQDGDFLKSK